MAIAHRKTLVTRHPWACPAGSFFRASRAGVLLTKRNSKRTRPRRHGTESRLTLFELEHFEQKIGIPAGFFTACLDASAIFVGAYEAESKTANDGHILGAMAGSIAG